MKNRFSREKGDFSTLKQVLLPVATLAATGALFYFSFASINKNAAQEQLRAMEQAVSRAAVQCYAAEGHYPPSLDYLKDHYGLMLDEEKYIIQYDVFASNIMPTVLVLPKNFQAEDQDPMADAAEEMTHEAW